MASTWAQPPDQRMWPADGPPPLCDPARVPGRRLARCHPASHPHGRDDDVPNAGGQRKRVLLPAQTHRWGRETGFSPRRGPTGQGEDRCCKRRTPPPGSRVSAEPSARTNSRAGVANRHARASGWTVRNRPPKRRARPAVDPTGFPRKCSSQKVRTGPCWPAVNRTGARSFIGREGHLRVWLWPGMVTCHSCANESARSSEKCQTVLQSTGQSAAPAQGWHRPGPTRSLGGDVQYAADSSHMASAQPASLRWLLRPEPPVHEHVQHMHDGHAPEPVG